MTSLRLDPALARRHGRARRSRSRSPSRLGSDRRWVRRRRGGRPPVSPEKSMAKPPIGSAGRGAVRLVRDRVILAMRTTRSILPGEYRGHEASRSCGHDVAARGARSVPGRGRRATLKMTCWAPASASSPKRSTTWAGVSRAARAVARHVDALERRALDLVVGRGRPPRSARARIAYLRAIASGDAEDVASRRRTGRRGGASSSRRRRRS